MASKSNIGRVIKDSFCNGFFGSSNYNLKDAIIVSEGNGWIVVKKTNGLYSFANFQGDANSNSEYDTNIDDNIIDNYLKDWCSKKED